MIVKLFCPTCAYKASKNLKDRISIDVPVPVEQIKDDGKYQVKCAHGHINTVILDNIKFELLFEAGVNAVIDGYYRESVSSFASSLERFFEFYWNVAMVHLGKDQDYIDQTWKPLSRLSERQIGAFSTAALILTDKPPTLLNPNKEIAFRNKVIHNGYIPDEEEATEFGNTIMKVIIENLDDLRKIAPDSLDKVYQNFTPESPPEEDEDELIGRVNILTCVDVRYPDKEAKVISDHFKRILRDRTPNRMSLLTKEEFEKYNDQEG